MVKSTVQYPHNSIHNNTYGDNETVSKDVTVTQAAAPLIYTTIPALFEAATGTETNVLVTFNNWVVSGVSSNGKNVFVTDNNGNGFVIYYGSDMSSTFAAGNILSGTAVSCTLKKYNGFAELLNVTATDLTITSGGTVTVADVALEDLAGVNTGALLHYDNLTCSVDNNKYYLSDGTTSIQVYNAIYAFGTLVEGKTYNITGVYQQYNNTKEILPRSAADIEEVEVQHEEYTLTVTPSANVEIYTFVSDDPNEEGQSGELIAQVYDGTTVGLSVSAASGYMLESVLVDGVDVTSQLDDTGWYEFTMPTHDVAVTATAVEYVPFEGGTYILATSIESGKNYIIVGQGDSKYYAMGEQKPNNRAAVEISVDGTTATVSSEDVHEFTISSLDAEGFYSIQDASSPGYLYAASNSSNYLKTETTLDENHNGDWKITINSEGIASVVASNSDNRNVMQYNSGNKLFACYVSASQHPVYLYVKEETPITEPHTVYFFEGTGDCGTVSLTGSSITLPDAENTDGWAFAGWSTAAVNESDEAPATLVASPYAPAEDMPLYAVYAKNGVYSTFPAVATTQLDVTEGFESYTESQESRTFVKPTGWTLVFQEPVARSKKGRPQVFYSDWYAHGGDYGLYMDTISVLAMPKLDEDINFSGLEVEFYLIQPFDYHHLDVGVMSDLSDPASFELIETVSNVGSAQNRKVVDFSGYQGTGRYIAFRNAYGEESVENGMRKSFNYIDDIVLRMKTSTCYISELPYTQSFDSLTDNTETRTGVEPECWTEAQRYGNYAAAYAPQLFHSSTFAQSGAYTLMLDGRCIYAMPEFKVEGKRIGDVQLEFYVKQYSSDCSLEVGVMSNLNDANSFVALDTIRNNGYTGQQRHAVDFGRYADRIPEGAKYIAFKNVYNGAWGRSPHYIDDINLAERESEDCGITELPYKQNFDSLTDNTEMRTGVQPGCWTEARKDANYTATYAPQLFYAESYAQSGSYTLMLDGRCIYAMPEIKVEGKTIGDMQVKFYVRQYSSSCSLQVGVMSNLNDAGTFVALDTISNNGFAGQQVHTVDFGRYTNRIPEGAKYIAFRNTYEGTWGRSPHYIDDIELTEREESCGITELPYTQDFDTLTDITEIRTGYQPECWTEVRKDANYAAAYAPQLFHAVTYAQSGEYTLMLDGRCIYAMPEFKVEGKSISDVQLEFYVRQYSADCSLQVGVMSDLDGIFVELETISNNGAAGQQVHVVDFSQYANSIPADAKYIAFRNIYSGTWGRSPQYLDDIVISVPEAKIAEVSSENMIDANSVERYLEDIRVYPNPTTGNLYIDAMDVQKVECYNQMGQLVGVYDNANELNISDLSNGVYMLRITVPQGVTMRKVVKR